jgi:hypothetical protein
MRTVEVERVKLAGADLSGVGEPAVREALRSAFVDAYVAAFRVVMLVCGGLAAVGGVIAGLMVSDSGRGSANSPERMARHL